MSLLAPTSWGDLIDRITILEIKREKIADAAKRLNVERELAALSQIRSASAKPSPDLDHITADLKAVNLELWVIEDDIRDCERAKDFGQRFIALARAVYQTNDRRALLKRKVNDLLGSDLVEEKSYQPY